VRAAGLESIPDQKRIIARRRNAGLTRWIGVQARRGGPHFVLNLKSISGVFQLAGRADEDTRDIDDARMRDLARRGVSAFGT